MYEFIYAHACVYVYVYTSLYEYIYIYINMHILIINQAPKFEEYCPVAQYFFHYNTEIFRVVRIDHCFLRLKNLL
jgi:hypothetical protein